MLDVIIMEGSTVRLILHDKFTQFTWSRLFLAGFGRVLRRRDVRCSLDGPFTIPRPTYGVSRSHGPSHVHLLLSHYAQITNQPSVQPPQGKGHSLTSRRKWVFVHAPRRTMTTCHGSLVGLWPLLSHLVTPLQERCGVSDPMVACCCRVFLFPASAS